MSPKRKQVERHLFLDERTGIYYWRERINGVDREESTGERTLGAARAAVKKFRTAADASAPRAKERRTVGQALDLLVTIAEGNAARSLASIKTQFNHLRPWLMGRDATDDLPALPAHCEYLDQFERDYPEIWSAYKQEQARLTPGRKLGHDRRYFLQALKAAREKGWLARDFENKDLPLLESADPIGRLVERDELERLSPHVRAVPKLWLQFRLALILGMRLREILHLRVAEVELKREMINLKGRRVKTRRGREVPIHDSLLPDLRAWVRACRGEFLFPAIHRGGHEDLSRHQDSPTAAWDRVRELSGVDCRFHDLRHTAISHMLEAGIPMGTVSMITGASMKVIMRIYSHLSAEGVKRFKKYNWGILGASND